MAAVKDIEFINDITIVNGDFKVIESDDQHIDHLLTADKGQFRQSPLIGIGLINELNSAVSKTALRQTIKLGLRADNYQVNKIDITDEFEIGIDADRLR